MPEPSKLPALYAEIAQITGTYCAAGCKEFAGRRWRCCERLYCEGARQHTLKTYGIDLPENSYVPELPFMGVSGCVLPAHFRPQCAAHACPLNLGGASKSAIDMYYLKRREIERVEREEGRPATFIYPTNSPAPVLAKTPPLSWSPALCHR